MSSSLAKAICAGSWPCIRPITMGRAPTWAWARTRRSGVPSNDPELSSPHQSWADCIIATPGYDFRGGQPKSLQQQWAARSYHGDAQNNSRAVINRFLGHYDGNPVNLEPSNDSGWSARVRPEPPTRTLAPTPPPRPISPEA